MPLSASYWDEKHRDANGVTQSVAIWAEVSLPPDRPPTTLDDDAAARHDLLLMGIGGAGCLLGMAADTKGDARTLRPLSHFAPETVSDADFAAAVHRGYNDMRELDEVRDLGLEGMLPPAGGAPALHQDKIDVRIERKASNQCAIAAQASVGRIQNQESRHDEPSLAACILHVPALTDPGLAAGGCTESP